jgi:hypothetical protein
VPYSEAVTERDAHIQPGISTDIGIVALMGARCVLRLLVGESQPVYLHWTAPVSLRFVPEFPPKSGCPVCHPEAAISLDDFGTDLVEDVPVGEVDLSDTASGLDDQAHPLDAVGASRIFKSQGIAGLPSEVDGERAFDVGQLDLSPRSFRTKFGGLFLFVPTLACLSLPRILQDFGFAGSELIPADCALRSMLALKLSGTAHRSSITIPEQDPGLALFAGLNVFPRRSLLTESSCRIDPACGQVFMQRWFDAVSGLGLPRGCSFDLGIQTIPFRGEEIPSEKHNISKRSSRQKGALAFLVQDAHSGLLCYANGELRKGRYNDEILRFAQFWRERTGQYPEELIFDSRLTTYAKLKELNTLGIQFITPRRRSKGLARAIDRTPSSAWSRIELKGVPRHYKHPWTLDRRITLPGYDGPVRQVEVRNLGDEEPMILLTNQLTPSVANLIERYTQRVIIGNSIQEGIDFFHEEARSSSIGLNVNCDLQLTLMASSLYRLLAERIAGGYERAKSRDLFRGFVNATANVSIEESRIVVCYQKRANNPLLIAAGFDQTETVIPWLGGKRLQLTFA